MRYNNTPENQNMQYQQLPPEQMAQNMGYQQMYQNTGYPQMPQDQMYQNMGYPQMPQNQMYQNMGYPQMPQNQMYQNTGYPQMYQNTQYQQRMMQNGAYMQPQSRQKQGLSHSTVALIAVVGIMILGIRMVAGMILSSTIDHYDTHGYQAEWYEEPQEWEDDPYGWYNSSIYWVDGTAQLASLPLLDTNANFTDSESAFHACYDAVDNTQTAHKVSLMQSWGEYQQNHYYFDEFNLNGECSMLTGNVFMPSIAEDTGTMYEVVFFTDAETEPCFWTFISSGDAPISFNIPVKGAEKLQIGYHVHGMVGENGIVYEGDQIAIDATLKQ